MKRKLCRDCHKNPIAYVTRQNHESKKLYVCKQCSVKYLTWGIVSKYVEIPKGRTEMRFEAVKL